ncbi:MAG: hypothetical protein NT115_06530 [Proteobacteria bacterium]|nr:hypothetical protein [Pseudomonadota bacterium]
MTPIAGSTINACLGAYYLSTNRARTPWILWLRLYDDNWGRWAEPHIYAHAPRQNVSAKVAATYLLLDAWSANIAEYELDRFHWINEAAVLVRGGTGRHQPHRLGRVCRGLGRWLETPDWRAFPACGDW